MNANRTVSSAAIGMLFLAVGARAQSTVRVSVNTAGLPGNGWSEAPTISADGRFVAFFSFASNLVPGDTNGFDDIFLHDRSTGITERVSVDSHGVQSNGDSWPAVLTPDGRYVAFASDATNLVPNDLNGWRDIFVRDRQLGTTELVSKSSAGAQANSTCDVLSISADGNVVGIRTMASNLVPGDTNGLYDVFVHERASGLTERVTISSGGAQANGGSGDSFAYHFLSGDGSQVVFMSGATNLVAGDTNNAPDIFVRDRTNGTTTRVSVDSNGAEANGSSLNAAISDDGRFVAFESYASNLVAGDTNGFEDVFVHDRLTSTTARISLDAFGLEANGPSGSPSISSDGRFVAFISGASDLVFGDSNALGDVFLRDRQLATNELVSVSTTGVQGNALPSELSVSSDGRFVTFDGRATNWIAGGATSGWDVYVRDRAIAVPVTSYCTAKSNSHGCTPFVSSSGLPLFSGYDAFFVISTAVLNQKTGVFFWGTQPAAIPFGGGTLCMQPPLVRSPLLGSGGSASGLDCSGHYAFQFRQSYMVAKGLAPGATIYGQFWSRDPGFAPPNNIGLTDAIAFTIAP